MENKLNYCHLCLHSVRLLPPHTPSTKAVWSSLSFNDNFWRGCKCYVHGLLPKFNDSLKQNKKLKQMDNFKEKINLSNIDKTKPKSKRPFTLQCKSLQLNPTWHPVAGCHCYVPAKSTSSRVCESWKYEKHTVRLATSLTLQWSQVCKVMLQIMFVCNFSQSGERVCIVTEHFIIFHYHFDTLEHVLLIDVLFKHKGKWHVCLKMVKRINFILHDLFEQIMTHTDKEEFESNVKFSAYI